MTPEETVARKCEMRERYRALLKKPQGRDELLVQIAVNTDVNGHRQDTHEDTPAHRAHPWTRETWLYVAAGVLLAVVGLFGYGAALPG